MMLVSMISYIDRNTLALLAPTILRDTRLSAEQYGFIISAFSIAYMLGNPVWGRILDRIGLRVGMTAAVSLWTVASASHAFAAGFRTFAAARTILGFGEGATFPGGLRTVMQTLPPEHRARGTAVAYSGGSFGAMITPLIVTPVAAAWGWRGAFWFTGAVGTLWLAVWAVLAQRPDLARQAPAMEPSPAGAAPKWGDPRVWAFIAAYALGAFPTGFVLYETSLYLDAVLHKSQIQIGAVLWIPPLGWEAGYFFWGWVTDRFTRAGASIPATRRMFYVLMWLSLPLAAVPRVDSFPLVMAMLFFAMFITSGFIIGSVAYATSSFPTGHSGLIAGLGAGSWSAVLAVVLPGVGRLFDLHRYNTAFLVAALFPIAGYAAWRELSRRTTVPSETFP
jgi:ACS family hexuronate transporter-like MFS transporter